MIVIVVGILLYIISISFDFSPDTAGFLRFLGGAAILISLWKSLDHFWLEDLKRGLFFFFKILIV